MAGGAAPSPVPPPLAGAAPEPLEADMIAPPCTFTTADGNQQMFYVDERGTLVHAYAAPGRPWGKEPLGAGWDPDSGLAHDTGTGGEPQVWGVRADGRRAQVYWNGRQWVTQPI
jgi:hypothetical protein